MIDPVDLEDFGLTFFTSAMVILLGASYALFYTFSKISHVKKLTFFAYLSYALLVVNVVLLSKALHLTGYWQIIVWTMLIGYLLAPHGIWHLCKATHLTNDNYPGKN